MGESKRGSPQNASGKKEGLPSSMEEKRRTEGKAGCVFARSSTTGGWKECGIIFHCGGGGGESKARIDGETEGEESSAPHVATVGQREFI